MNRASMRSSMHHRRLPSLESLSSAERSGEKHPRTHLDLHQALQFEPVSILKKAPEEGLTPPAAPGPFSNKGKDFWLVFLALCVSSFLAAIDLTGVSTVLVTMADDLNSDKYSWIGSAYCLASTALIPWTGGLAAIFGRRCIMNASLILFMAGSAVVGSAQSMAIAIAGRSIQGIGGGGILIMSDIIITDLIPLAHRGPFYGIIGCIWGGASAIGPPIGGVLATSGNWRWLFYLNIPVSAVALALVTFFFKLKSPKTTLKEKLDQMDWYNCVFVGAASAVIIGLSWGGIDYPWDSPATYGPIAGGVLGLGVFFCLEATVAPCPTVPIETLTHRNSLFGYITTFFHGFATMASVYYLPLYFQSTQGSSAVRSGIQVFSLSFTVAPFAIIAGITITASGHYLAQNYVGWFLTITGFGLMTMLKADSGELVWVAYPVVAGCGLGILYTATLFPTLAPLRPEQHPAAMSFYNFARSFGQVFGIAIGSTTLTNVLHHKLPSGFLDAYGGSAEAAVPYLKALDEPLRTTVRESYATAISWIWYVSLGVAGLGLLANLGLTSMKLTEETDDRWGLENEGVVGVAAVAMAVAGLERVDVEKPRPSHEGWDDAPLQPPTAFAPGHRSRKSMARMSVDLLGAIGGRPSISGARMTMYEAPRPAPSAPVRMSVLGAPPPMRSAGGSGARGRTTSVDWRMSRI